MTDAELIEFATEFREGILDGGPSDMMCAAVCWPLASILRGCGVPCESAESKSVETDFGECNHVWIRLADGRVLDPTADQFSNSAQQYPPVYLGPPMELHRDSRQPPAGLRRAAAQGEARQSGVSAASASPNLSAPNPQNLPPSQSP